MYHDRQRACCWSGCVYCWTGLSADGVVKFTEREREGRGKEGEGEGQVAVEEERERATCQRSGCRRPCGAPVHGEKACRYKRRSRVSTGIGSQIHETSSARDDRCSTERPVQGRGLEPRDSHLSKSGRRSNSWMYHCQKARRIMSGGRLASTSLLYALLGPRLARSDHLQTVNYSDAFRSAREHHRGGEERCLQTVLA